MCKLHPYYITGFVDGEGCFMVTVNPHIKQSTGYRVKATFSICLHERDTPLLYKIKDFFEVGNISRMSKTCMQYRVTSLTDIEVIISHFEKYPLLTKKSVDFLLFKEIFNLMKQKEHLTSKGLEKILALKASLNLGLPEDLNVAFPNIVPVLRLNYEYTRSVTNLN